MDTIKDLEGEEWRDVVGYEGLYMVSNLGRLKSMPKKKGYAKITSEFLLKISIDKGGYEAIGLLSDGKPYRTGVHRIVAIAFIENPDMKPQVDHVNTVRTENMVSNLRWVTYKENNNNPLTILHASESKIGEKCYLFGKSGALHNKSKGVAMFNLGGDYIREFGSTREAEHVTGILHQSIAKCCRGILRKSSGYIWRYI